MRVMKFRAWSKTNKKMYDRVLAGPGDPCSIVYDEERKDWLQFDDACGDIMQFTGLHDKNGKDIYEYDVVCMFDWKALEIILWCDNGFYVVPLNSEDVSPSLIPHDHRGKAESVEIIGNIYEHPQYRFGVAEDLVN